MAEYTVIAINQEYELIESIPCSDWEEALYHMKKRFMTEKKMMQINNEDIIEDEIDEEKGRANLFYEDKGEVLGFVMYIIDNTKQHA